jgi:sec-independent protein translocase protein TatA
MFGGLGMSELIVIFMVVLLLFGAKRLPEIGSSLGKGIREFKSSVREIERELKVPEDRRVAEGRPAVHTPAPREVVTTQAGQGGQEDESEGPRKLGGT